MLCAWPVVFVLALGADSLSGPEEDADAAVEAEREDEAVSGADAGAAVEPGDAQGHVQAASEAYQAGDYERAANEIRRAYELEPAAELLFPWAQAERQRGDCATAIRLYARYLAEEPGETTADLARDHIETCIGVLESERAAAPAPAPAPKRPPRSDRGWIRDPLGGVLLGGGVVFVAAGAGMMIGGRSMMIDALEGDHAHYASTSARAVTVDRAGIAVACVGAAFIVGGVVRYALVHRREQREHRAELELGPDLSLRF